MVPMSPWVLVGEMAVEGVNSLLTTVVARPSRLRDHGS